MHRHLRAVANVVAVAIAVTLAPQGVEPVQATHQPSHVCTLADCVTSVDFHLTRVPSEARTARVCVRGRCKVRRVFNSRTISFGCSSNTPRRIRVSAALRDANGDRLVRDARRVRLRDPFHPNGPECPPTCYSGDLRFDGKSGELRRR